MSDQLVHTPSEIAATRPTPKIGEHDGNRLPGVPMFLLGFVLLAAGVLQIVLSAKTHTSAFLFTGIGCTIVGSVLFAGLVMVAPGQARVLQVLGRYTGTIRSDGFQWVNPIATKTPVSTRIRNHETTALKVNDADGNPVEIAAVVVWQVNDTAQAMFEVDNFVDFVQVQTETAVRHIATSYPYDNHGETGLSLRENADEITERLSAEVAARVTSAGVNVIESRITHLAYAPEIAHSMLQRQQASAMVAARQRIVEGAVGMVEMALDRLAERDVVDLDEERKAAMVSNLLVVLCGDRSTQPVVNTGSLYH
ncbi:SPFH domain-containing protein [Allokutzneria sp. A3M-2-11 16]|uniref:SPFH domain-containing protein n=1 Tax=Allokutzneria sp. A3M-2-11 16 TaxID=2962043 RepID=UPI0020B659F3|nr:SPFH domain-containing protein [Allokutzneria sp. A3M-2-11 16]MCP3800988.1 SPFH domain-containing protein [Allokutzneria sp. A3M-2-11 16]